MGSKVKITIQLVIEAEYEDNDRSKQALRNEIETSHIMKHYYSHANKYEYKIVSRETIKVEKE